MKKKTNKQTKAVSCKWCFIHPTFPTTHSPENKKPERFYSFILSLKDNNLVLFSAVGFSNVQSFAEVIGGTVVSSHLASQGTRGTTEKHAGNP